MAIIFDGRKYAERLTKRLSDEVIKFQNKNNRRPKLVSVYDPGHEPSRVYTAIKEKKAHELGILFEKYTDGRLIPEWNEDKTIDGIMVQTPMENDQELIEQIAVTKDVDGLKENSQYLQATVRAVVEILKEAKRMKETTKLVVVGAGGMVGSGLMDYMHREGVDNLQGLDSENFDIQKLLDADVIISAVGSGGLITADMVKDGVVAIDVGYPKGDFAPDVADKASFFTPVPGGVGPVTVISLFANLLKV